MAQVISGQKTVAAAGTAERIYPSSFRVSIIIIRALSGNTGNVFVGGPTVDNANGYILEQGWEVAMIADDIGDIYIDAANNGDGITFLATDEQ